MIKSSASDGDGDETVRYEISHSGYVTTDEDMELPNYLVHSPSNNDVITEMDVEEELDERGKF